MHPITMLSFLCALFLSFPIAILCQTWHGRACINDHVGYIEKLAQETMYALEKDVKFCNLRVDDFNQTINEQMYSWHLSGLARYTDGFLISINYVTLTQITSMVTRGLVDDVPQYFASVAATIKFNFSKIGFNLLVQLDNQPDQRFTSTFIFDEISFLIRITRDLNTNETSYSTSIGAQPGRLNKMDFLPSTNVSQVVGRNFAGYLITDSFTKWGREIIVPIMQQLGESAIPFPNIKLGGCQ